MGLKHGKGKRTNKDSSSYDGQYEDDKPHGKGTYIWNNGDKYTGMWKEGLFDGMG